MSSSRFMFHTARAALVLPFLISTGCAEKKAEESAPAEAAPTVDLSSSDLFAPTATARPQVAPTTVVVTVNGKAITQGEIDEETAGVVNNMRGRVPPERIAQLQQQIDAQAVESIVTRTLLEQEVEKAAVALTDTEIAFLLY